MGQQQLLLIILGTIIVAIAIVVGINMMGSASEQANLDAVRVDLMSIGTSAQGWYSKPTMMQGGGNSFQGIEFTKFSFPADSVASDGSWAENQNARYTIDAGNSNATQFVVDADPAQSDSTLSVTVTQGNVAISQ